MPKIMFGGSNMPDKGNTNSMGYLIRTRNEKKDEKLERFKILEVHDFFNGLYINTDTCLFDLFNRI